MPDRYSQTKHFVDKLEGLSLRKFPGYKNSRPIEGYLAKRRSGKYVGFEDGRDEDLRKEERARSTGGNGLGLALNRRRDKNRIDV